MGRALLTLLRAEWNFLENALLAFIFLTFCEFVVLLPLPLSLIFNLTPKNHRLNGGDRKVLNYIMASFFALRIAHADCGLILMGKWGNCGIGRSIGYWGSLGVVTGLGGWLVKSY